MNAVDIGSHGKSATTGGEYVDDGWDDDDFYATGNFDAMDINRLSCTDGSVIVDGYLR